MDGDKDFLTYNQQMKHLRSDKSISCYGTEDKVILCRYGYFNLVNGYKNPFVCGFDETTKKHLYLPGTSIKHLYYVKEFDDDLRVLLLKYISMAEEEVRTFFAYKFDELNKKGAITWYQVEAFDGEGDVDRIVATISKAYQELSRSKAEYVQFYMEKHKFIPMWILIKCINFSTFIDFVQYSKQEVKEALCDLYGMLDERGYRDFKLLIGSLQWMRIVRNACAHNERIYTITRRPARPTMRSIGRIVCSHLRLLPTSYHSETEQKVIDLLIYLKYFLAPNDFDFLIDNISNMLLRLQEQINPIAFGNVRGQLGVKDLLDLQKLKENPRIIPYNKF